jgi:hypothetical protein
LQWLSADGFIKASVLNNIGIEGFYSLPSYDDWRKNVSKENPINKQPLRLINDATHLVKLMRNYLFGVGIIIENKRVTMYHWLNVFKELSEKQNPFRKDTNEEVEPSPLKSTQGEDTNQQPTEKEKEKKEKEKKKKEKKKKFKILLGGKELDISWLNPRDLMDHEPLKGVLFIAENIKTYLEENNKTDHPSYLVKLIN